MRLCRTRSCQSLITLDYRRDMILVAVHREGEQEKIVAVGRYHVDPATGAAEVAFSMRDDWQRQGIGTHLFGRLLQIARRRGVTAFYAEIMADNLAMVRLFHTCALGTVESRLEGGVYHLAFTVSRGIQVTG